MSNRETNENYQLAAWLAFEALLPVILMLLVWPITSLVNKIPYGYEKTFSSTDLLPIAALLLIGSLIQVIFRAQDLVELPGLMYLSLGAAVFAVLFLFVHGFFKAYYLTYTFPDQSVADPAIVWFGHISLISIAFSIAYGFLIRSRLALELTKRQRQSTQ